MSRKQVMEQSQINEAEEVKAIPIDQLKQFRNEVMNMNSIAIIQRLDKLIEEVEDESKESEQTGITC